MRKFILVVAAALAPIAVWTAGCRQETRQAAFPKGPEMKNLARAPEAGGGNQRAPMVAVIDPEVLNTPDQPTFARIRAVMDREAQIAGRYQEQPGLFVLPSSDQGLAVAPIAEPVYLPEPAMAAAPTVSDYREFRSQPAAPRTYSPQTSYPADISAMAPAAPPVGASAPDPLLLPEAIPGVYMGTEDMFDDIPGVGWIGAIDKSFNKKWEGGATALPPHMSMDAMMEASMRELELALREIGDIRPRNEDISTVPITGPATTTGSLASGGTGKVAELLKSFETSEALAPLPDLSVAAAPAVPVVSESGLAAAPALLPEVQLPEMEMDPGILLPLPPLAAPAMAVAGKMDNAAVLATAKTDRDFYMTDFWQGKAVADPTPWTMPDLAGPISILDFEPAAPDLVMPEPLPALSAPPSPPAEISVAVVEAVEPELARLPEPPALEVPPHVETRDSMSESAHSGHKPILVPLRPLLEKPPLQSSLSRIDASVDAPPVVF